jgi:hypothetical protein
VDQLLTDFNLKDMQQLQLLLLKARNSAVNNEGKLSQ